MSPTRDPEPDRVELPTTGHPAAALPAAALPTAALPTAALPVDGRSAAALPAAPQAVGVATSWSAQWAAVPPAWREPVYRIDTAPASEVFLLNRRYLTGAGAGAEHDFAPLGPARLGQEIAWWVFTCWREGLRKVEPSLLAWTRDAISHAAREHRGRTGTTAASITDLTVAEILRHALVLFSQRNGRLPSTGTRRNITHQIEHLHLLASARCTDAPWWSNDTWDLRADPRIPQRPHEPRHDHTVKLGGAEPTWLREGLRFWLRCALTHQLLTWSSVIDRARILGTEFGGFCRHAGHTGHPAIATDPPALRAVFLEFLDYLRTPPAGGTGRPPRSADTIATVQSYTQAFYAFLYDHGDDAAFATGDRRFAEMTEAHLRLWSPIHRVRTPRHERELSWHSTADLQRMLAYLDVLGANPDEKVTITHPDGRLSVVAGLGDPQAARAWLLQALTGRRASEILMLDYDPLEPIPGLDHPAATRATSRTDTDAAVDTGDRDGAADGDETADGDDTTFVAKLRYQQTKVDGVIPTIMVEQAVVDLIVAQQRWLAQTHPDLAGPDRAPRYLFLGLLHHHHGTRPRSYATYRASLARLDEIHGLRDSAGHPLRFTQTHRLRHTRATELLNDGVPFHVVQRYLGHKSPEMTARYAVTLAATAEAEFLKHKKIGAYGAAIGISPNDIYEMTQLDKRTDRVLPNGVCLLPPLKSCDKGNACLSCGHFATDRSHLDDLVAQRADTERLLARRRAAYRERAGRELTDDNVWVRERLRELASLDAIITKLRGQPEDGAGACTAAAGAGTANRLPLLQIQTRGAHESLLDATSRQHDPSQGSPHDPPQEPAR